MNEKIARQRLQRQWITHNQPRRPAEVVAWLGAVQAQEYAAAKWALSLRTSEETLEREIDRACDDGLIIRTHVMRPTWHFVAAADIRWLLSLTAPRVHQAIAYARRSFELDPALCRKTAGIFERSLRDSTHLTRAELGARLRRARVDAKGIRLALLTIHAELEGVICNGPRRGKESTYALLAERAPHAKDLPRDEALAELTGRFFTSHGPATARDFSWWSGLTMAAAKRGLEMTSAKASVIDGLTYWTIGAARQPAPREAGVHLLPVYDEYLVAYRDRTAVPHMHVGSGVVTFQNPLASDGQVAGRWKPSRTGDRALVTVQPSRRLTGREQRQIDDVVARYSRFLGVPASWTAGES